MIDSELLKAMRALLAELNRTAASGLITHQALVLMNRVQQLMPETA